MNQNVADYYRALANPVRLEILLYIADESEGTVPSSPKTESCVTAISKALKIPQPTVSNHLKKLKEVGLVKSVNKDTHCYQYVTKEATEALLNHSTYLYNQAHANPY